MAFAFSIPVALVFLSMGSVSESMNEVYLVIALLAFIMALPWSIFATVIFLFAVPLHSGLHPGMEGYYWRFILGYAAPVITVLGAHFNGFMIGRSLSRLKIRLMGSGSIFLD